MFWDSVQSVDRLQSLVSLRLGDNLIGGELTRVIG
jgi:hypothetical protein